MKLSIFALALFVGVSSYGQSCSTTNPCAPGSVSGPTGTTVTLYKCGGTCTPASLAAYLANPASTNQWVVVGTFPQTVSPRAYHDPEAYGSQWSYAATNTAAGGTPGAPSNVSTFQFPQAPQTPTTLTMGTSAVTSGTAGPQ